MAKRKGISKKTRFEVFKRDSFTCQYCGAKSPDVILVVDHVKPVKADGDNSIINLITACQPCNAGKGARELSDQSALEKQRRQLDELNERREQLKMLVDWREELNRMTDQSVSAVEAAILSRTGMPLTANGRLSARKWIARYGLQKVLDATETALTQYMQVDGDGRPDFESVKKAWNYIPRIINTQNRMQEKPYLKDLFYIRGILRNRLHYCDERECMRLLEQAHVAGSSIDSLREFSRTVRNWTAFRDEMERFIEENAE